MTIPRINEVNKPSSQTSLDVVIRSVRYSASPGHSGYRKELIRRLFRRQRMQGIWECKGFSSRVRGRAGFGAVSE